MLEAARVLAPLQMRILKQWQELARKWVWSNDGGGYTCGACGTLIHRTHDSQGKPYLIKPTELEALEVCHLRRFHESEIPRED